MKSARAIRQSKIFRMPAMDLEKASLFGSSSASSPVMKRRRLISSNPVVVESYLRYSNEKIKNHVIIQKLSKFIDDWSAFTSVDRETTLNKIDDQ